MTNILSLPQLPQMDPFVIATDSDFRDGVQMLLDDSVDPPIAVDIAGIAFRATIRAADALEDEVLIFAATADGTLTIDAPNGLVRFALPADALRNLEPQTAYGDLVAVADGVTINLSKDHGPLEFTIRRGLA